MRVSTDELTLHEGTAESIVKIFSGGDFSPMNTVDVVIEGDVRGARKIHVAVYVSVEFLMVASVIRGTEYETDLPVEAVVGGLSSRIEKACQEFSPVEYDSPIFEVIHGAATEYIEEVLNPNGQGDLFADWGTSDLEQETL